MPLADRDLLLRIASNDQDAFELLYDRYADRVFGFLLRIIGQHNEAEDVLQETFWQVWSRASGYDSQRASPVVWLFCIARSRALDHLRRRRCRPAPTAMAEPPRSREDVSTAVVLEDLHSLTRNALARLPREQSQAIALAFYAGLTHEEIARQESVPLGTVKTRIRRGMQRLRSILDPHQTEVAS